MATRRTSFEKLQRDRDKKARAAAKHERRAERRAEAEAASEEAPPVPEGGELSAAQLLAEVERIHKQFDDEEIDFETFEELKSDLLSRIPVE
jgi:hypothetical protein